MSNKSILVTGGAGYIGSHVCKALSQAGYTPITLDNTSTGNAKRVKWGPFVKGSLFDDDIIKKICRDHKPIGLIHLAAFTDIRESIHDPEKYYHNNAHGTRALLSSLADSSIEVFIFSSSCSVYGIPEKCPVTEETKTHPISPYGESKLLSELMFQGHCALHDKRAGILRYFNVAGCDPEGEIGETFATSPRITARAIVAMQKGDTLTINGDTYPTPDGTCVRDYIHPTDLAKAHVLLLDYLLEHNENQILNLSTGQGHSLIEVVKTLEEITGKTLKTQVGPAVEGDPPALYATADKAHILLNWQPQYSDLKTIIKTAWDFACAQS